MPPIRDPARAWFFDLDGTIVVIARSPEKVRLGARMRELIEGLYRTSGGALAIITGRTIANVDRLFPGLRLPVAGQHGAERRNAAGRLVRHPSPSRRLDRVREELGAVVARYPKLLLEDKGLSLALHYRRAPTLGGMVHRVARTLVARLGERYVLERGKYLVEIRPTGRDKGTAIRAFMHEPPFRGRQPIFLGDDASDEFGFAMINRLGGISVKIGRGATVARWRLRDVSAVRDWLAKGIPVPRDSR